MPKRTHDGLKKRCSCSKRVWAKCPHPWHVNFHHAGTNHRLSLDEIARQRGERPPTSKTEAIAWRDRLRGEIRGGTFGQPVPGLGPTGTLTLGDILDQYVRRHVDSPTRRDGARATMHYHIGILRRVQVPGPAGTSVPLAGKPITAITKADVEAVREARRTEARQVQAARETTRAARAQGDTSATMPRIQPVGAKAGEVGINRLLARLRHVCSWAVAEGHLEQSPFKRGGVTVVRLETRVETARTRRLEPGEEARLLQHAGPHLRALIVAALSTGCRVGELLSLRWAQIRRDEHGEPRWIVLQAAHTKTNEARTIPIGATLRAELAMRRHAPDGEEHPPTAHVFGNAVGEPVASIKTAWRATCRRAGIEDLHFHDLRREFACRLLESRADMHDVRDFLGHANITTTSRYVQSTPVRLARALQRMEDESAAPEQHEADADLHA